MKGLRVALAAAACALVPPSTADAAPTPQATPRLLKAAYVTTGSERGTPRRSVRRTVRQFFGVVVFGRQPPAGRQVDFFFYGPTGKLEAGLVGKLRTRTSDQVLYATVRRSRVHFEQRPGRWRLLVRVGALSRSWRFRIR